MTTHTCAPVNNYRGIYIAIILIFFSCSKVSDRSKPTELTARDAADTATHQSDTLTEEQYARYKAAYREPSVVFLRKAITAYLDNSSEHCADSSLLQEFELQSAAEGNGLGAFSKEYYTSKFVVLWINAIPGQGDQVGILFKKKPDRIFEALMIKTDEDEFLLGTFEEKPASKEKLQKWVQTMQQYLDDDQPEL